MTSERWQIGIGKARHNANIIYTEGADIGSGEAVCSVEGVWCHKTLGEIEELIALGVGGSEHVAKRLATARMIAAAPEMYEFVKLLADGGNSHARKLVAKVTGEVIENKPISGDYVEEVECPQPSCDCQKAEAFHSWQGGTKYVCLKCGFKWEEPCY